jgi:hypothetical protein
MILLQNEINITNIEYSMMQIYTIRLLWFKYLIIV